MTLFVNLVKTNIGYVEQLVNQYEAGIIIKIHDIITAKSNPVQNGTDLNVNNSSNNSTENNREPDSKNNPYLSNSGTSSSGNSEGNNPATTNSFF